MKGTQLDRVRNTAAVLLDVLVTGLSYSLAPFLREVLDPWLLPLAGTWTFDPRVYHLFLPVAVVCVVVSLWLLGCYELSRRRTVREAVPRLLGALILAHLLFILAGFYAKAEFLSRGVLMIFLTTNFAGLMSVRWLVDHATQSRARRRTIVVGTDTPAIHLAEVLSREEGHEIVGHLDPGGTSMVDGRRVLGTVENTADVLSRHKPIDELALAVRDPDTAAPAVAAAEDRGIALRQLVLPIANGLHRVYFEHVGGLNMLTMNASAADEMTLFIKRIIDIVGGVIGLVATTLLVPFVALAIKAKSKGPVFYRQQRVGRNGRTFTIYKFRTMIVGAHEMRDDLAALNTMKGPRFKIENDPRITPVGRFLRRFSIDELPQFFSVLKGDMSLVGPRPFPVEEVQAYSGRQHRRLGMKPGLTGLWQTRGRCDLKDFSQMLELDEEYIQDWSLWLDFKILLRTIPAVIFGRGAM